MAWYVVHVGHMLGIYRTWEDCYAQVNRYPGNLHKKYNTEAEALRAYYSHPAYLVLGTIKRGPLSKNEKIA